MRYRPQRFRGAHPPAGLRTAPRIGAALSRSAPNAFRLGLIGALALLGQSASGLTLAELQDEPGLTPETLIRHFADFKFELSRDLREPAAFLSRKAGDCDDFATLAADLLRAKGYHPRLVVVFMPKDAHVVCYVAEANGYLDYNRRRLAEPVARCAPELTAIAVSVAESFKCAWRSASEFTIQNGNRHFVLTEFH